MKPRTFAVILVLFVSACETIADSTYLTERSVSGYQVRLRGDLAGKPNREFTSNVVLFELLAPVHRRPLELYRADKRDFAFRSQYPSETWLEENILRFESNYGKGLNSVRVGVWNDSKQPVEALRINCGDLFLLFDLSAGARLSFRSPASLFVEALGRFADGRSVELQHAQAAFDEPSQINGIDIVISQSGGITFKWQ
jgi:hypothetical protein